MDTPFSVFTTCEKCLIVCIVGIAGLFSPLTANIYLPAIPIISSAFHKSVELIDLTVTTYMAVQGIAPMLWAAVADKYGRRPVYLACLLILAVACVGLALVPVTEYWLLVVLRCLQAVGSSSTLALGAGVIVDITSPSERGTFLGLFALGPMVGPCFGPVIGGILSDRHGWRSIFWFLAISGSACLVSVFLFLPETLRSMVGNGSISAPKWNRPLIPIIGRTQRGISPESKPPPRHNPHPLQLFTHPDVMILLTLNGSIYSVFYAVTTSISALLTRDYHFLSGTQTGLCYLAVGGGIAFSSFATGRLLDLDYKHIKQRLGRCGNELGGKSQSCPSDDAFPIEFARLRTMHVYLCIFAISCVGYGWCLERKLPLAGPLTLLVALGYSVVAIMNITQTLIMDLFPKQGSSITAANNLIRCLGGAALVAVIDMIIHALGEGWTFTLLASVCMLISPILFWEIQRGPVWRARRKIQDSKRNLQRE